MKAKLGSAGLFLASWAYVGYFPVAPGTAGSAAALLVDWGLRTVGSPVIHGVVLLVLAVGGVHASGLAEKELAEKDPSVVVIDEVVGMLAALYLIPLSGLGILAGFLLFRLLDIVKPFPCRQAEKLPGGVGIVADDVIAGVYTNLLLRLACLLWPALLSQS
ncbi:MAG: phosphatidylglycerophosphatase A [Acidobacteriota bacterium]